MAAQEIETQKANSKFEFNVSEQEKLKKNFELEKKIWTDEKAGLVTRAETAKASLANATAELTSLQRQISWMVSGSLVSYLKQALNIVNIPSIVT